MIQLKGICPDYRIFRYFGFFITETNNMRKNAENIYPFASVFPFLKNIQMSIRDFTF